MSDNRKRKRVKFGPVSITLWHSRDGWRFAYPDPSAPGGRRYIVAKDINVATEKARSKAAQIAKGVLDLNAITPEQAALCREFLSLNPSWKDLDRIREFRHGSASLSGLIAEFVSHKVSAKGGKSRHIRRLELDLLDMCDALNAPQVHEVTPNGIRGWLDSKDVGGRRRAELRAAAVSLWRWGVKMGHIAARGPSTVPEMVPTTPLPRVDSRRILSPGELRFLFRVISPEFQPWLALCAFSGLRSGEVFSWHKPPLRWDQVKEAHIELLPSQSKTGRRRLVPVLGALRRHLRAKEGAILERPANVTETGRLGALMDEEFKRSEGWPRNCLRHSYGSYRVAQTRNIPAVALEMGNSAGMVEKHYLEATTQQEAEEWFGV